MKPSPHKLTFAILAGLCFCMFVALSPLQANAQSKKFRINGEAFKKMLKGACHYNKQIIFSGKSFVVQKKGCKTTCTCRAGRLKCKPIMCKQCPKKNPSACAKAMQLKKIIKPRMHRAMKIAKAARPMKTRLGKMIRFLPFLKKLAAKKKAEWLRWRSISPHSIRTKAASIRYKNALKSYLKLRNSAHSLLIRLKRIQRELLETKKAVAAYKTYAKKCGGPCKFCTFNRRGILRCHKTMRYRSGGQYYPSTNAFEICMKTVDSAILQLDQSTFSFPF